MTLFVHTIGGLAQLVILLQIKKFLLYETDLKILVFKMHKSWSKYAMHLITQFWNDKYQFLNINVKYWQACAKQNQFLTCLYLLLGVAVSQVLDMRDPEFEVSTVRESDVIHANKKDVPCIFRVTTSLMDPPGVRHQCLMLADTESEKTKWVVALNELHRILKKNQLPSRIVFR